MPFLGQLKKKALYFSNGTLIFFLNVKEQRLWTCCLCWRIDCYACLHTPVAFLTFVPRQPNHSPCVGDFSWSTLLSFSCNHWSLSPQTSWVTCNETRIQRICLKLALSQVPSFISLNNWNTDLCWVVTLIRQSRSPFPWSKQAIFYCLHLYETVTLSRCTTQVQ